MRERGYTHCRGRGRLARGPQAVGSETSVSISVGCPSGTKPAALFHTHTRTIKPSAQDMESGRKFNLPVCIRLGQRIKCYPVKGNRPS